MLCSLLCCTVLYYTILYRVYLHHYTQYVEESVFSEAADNLQDLGYYHCIMLLYVYCYTLYYTIVCYPVLHYTMLYYVTLY